MSLSPHWRQGSLHTGRLHRRNCRGTWFHRRRARPRTFPGGGHQGRRSLGSLAPPAFPHRRGAQDLSRQAAGRAAAHFRNGCEGDGTFEPRGSRDPQAAIRAHPAHRPRLRHGTRSRRFRRPSDGLPVRYEGASAYSSHVQQSSSAGGSRKPGLAAGGATRMRCIPPQGKANEKLSQL